MNGILDAHIHVWEYSLFRYFPNLVDVKSIDEVFEKLKEKTYGDWVVGVRFNQEGTDEKTIPDRFMLDKVFGKRPVVIVRTCLHLMAMNTEAMKRLGVISLNGIFFEADVFGILTQLTSGMDVERSEIIDRGMAELKRLGVTRVIDMAMDKNKHRWLDNVDYYTTDHEILDDALGFKLFLDGSFGAHTAALNKAYADNPGNYGALTYNDEDLITVVQKIHKRGKPISYHALGDRAVDQFLRVAAKSRHPKDRVEHVQYARADQLEKLAEWKVPVCIQPISLREISWAAGRLGPDRMKTAYAWGLMDRMGVPLLTGSDAPVDTENPFEAAYVSEEAEGNHHLDYDRVMQIYRSDNWRFYGWTPDKITQIEE